MSGELGVYASFLKDSLYAVTAVFLFWVAKWPVQWVFYFHALTWLAFSLYYVSNDLSFWAPTCAAIITLGVSSFDAFALLNVICYLPHTTCCIGDHSTSPFTIGEPVCGPNDRYDPPTLTWLAISAIGMGVLTGVSRVVGLSITRKGMSVEMAIGALYIGLKLYLLLWRGVTYTPVFIFLSVLTMAWQVSGNLAGFKYRFVAVLLLLGIVLIDLLALLGATRTITFFQAGTPSGGNRRLHSWKPSDPAWRSSDGQAVPVAVRRTWVGLHILFLVLAILQILGWLTRSKDLPTPFGAPKQQDDADEAQSSEFKVAATGASKYAGYNGGTAKRNKAAASSYI
jgi:hypothetical protein